jgi:IclR family transcriptional regulator, acetate operon repressor
MSIVQQPLKGRAPKPKASPASQPRATDRGLRLLSIVADHPNGIALADAARSADLSPSTALRQLRSLAGAGFAVQLQSGKWVPGDELLRIARTLTTSDTLVRLAQPLLVHLAQQTGESAYVVEPRDKNTATYVAMEPSRHAIRHVSWLGQLLDRRSTAAGAALKGQVDADGTALRDDAVELGVTAISAPVRDMSGVIVAALSVVGPTYRLHDFGIHQARDLVFDTAAVLSEKLGAVPSLDEQ